MKIFICEDNDVQKNRIIKSVEEIIEIENFHIEIALATENPKEIINYLKEKTVDIGLYFLDVDLNTDINGIQLASEIRKYDTIGAIVFVTAKSECAPLTFEYKVEAMDYIIKDNLNEVHKRIQQCIISAKKKYLSMTTKSKKKFAISTNDRVIIIETERILFFETSYDKNRVVLHGIDRQIQFYSNLKKIEEVLMEINLSDKFYRSHKSFLVNKYNIREIDLKNRVINMINGEVCEISAREVRKLKKANYIKELIIKENIMIL